eukprot:2918582-Rhodomonas_salina.3
MIDSGSSRASFSRSLRDSFISIDQIWTTRLAQTGSAEGEMTQRKSEILPLLALACPFQLLLGSFQSTHPAITTSYEQQPHKHMEAWCRVVSRLHRKRGWGIRHCRVG